MRRRRFVLLASGAAMMPFMARAQAPTRPVIGMLGGASPDEWEPYVAAFRKGLGELGFAEGTNVAIEYRWARGQPERLPALAAELIELRVAVIAALGGGSTAAKARTSDIPIVFTVADLLPGLSRVALLVTPSNPQHDFVAREMETAGVRLGISIQTFSVDGTDDIDGVFAALRRATPQALVVPTGSEFSTHPLMGQIVRLAAEARLPTIYGESDWAALGGLMTYTTNAFEMGRRAATFVDRILKGAKPGELPIEEVEPQLVVNLKTARELGIEVPATLLVRADQVIE